MDLATMAQGLIGVLAIIGLGTLIFAVSKLLAWVVE